MGFRQEGYPCPGCSSRDNWDFCWTCRIYFDPMTGKFIRREGFLTTIKCYLNWWWIEFNFNGRWNLKAISGTFRLLKSHWKPFQPWTEREKAAVKQP